MIDQIYVFDDIITKNHQELIKELLFDTHAFSWYIKPDLSGNTNKAVDEKFTAVPGFANIFYNNLGITNTELFKYSLPIAQLAFAKINQPLNRIHFGRTFFQFPLTTHSGVSNPHVDMEQQDHIVVLYYAIDADGDTLLLDKTDDGLGRPSFDNYNIIKRITPKQGRCVVFNGRIYHTAILPRLSQRCVINMNLT